MIPSYTLTGNGRHNLQTFIIVVLFQLEPHVG